MLNWNPGMVTDEAACLNGPYSRNQNLQMKAN